MLALVVISYALSPLIDAEIFRLFISPIQNIAIVTVTIINTWALWRHSEGLRIRRYFSGMMACLALLTIIAIFQRLSMGNSQEATEGIFSFEGWEMLFGDIIAWLFLAYPSELLRPGWLSWKNAITRLLPVIFIGVVDYFVPWDLRWLLVVVPIIWIILLYRHVRSYRKYCEDNFSSMEETDERWVIRYLLMMLILGVSYAVLCFLDTPTRLFTQQWLIFFILVYTNDQVMFRSKPWLEKVESTEPSEEVEEPVLERTEAVSEVEVTNDANAKYRRALEEWMDKEKPYLRQEFRLTDLREVLPMNRTYISQFINAEYGCTFYQFVTNYRIAEAKRLMRENPNMKMQDVSEQSGFSSLTVFGRIFARETGLTPSEWKISSDNS
ncbi:MAG: AraC family transcriptional regulator [Paludibacteraceae bacterium]|nr:AraC family transcriptional regulator [Paludibacteraceae bacterium]